MSLLDDFQRVSRKHPCPLCEKPDWCLVERGSTGSPATVICKRVESKHNWGEAGWFHRLHGTYEGPRTRVHRLGAERPTVDVEGHAARCIEALPSDRLADLGATLGVSEASLVSLGVGWDGEAFTFPMRDEHRVVTGIRRRLLNGRMFALTGSREGLFFPAEIGSSERLFICEGPSDTAALLDLGLPGIGRPCCTGGVRTLQNWVRLFDVHSVIVIADNDGPGIKGGKALAQSLRHLCTDVRIIAPPGEGHDVRDWVRSGATAADIEIEVERTPKIEMPLSVRLGGSV